MIHTAIGEDNVISTIPRAMLGIEARRKKEEGRRSTRQTTWILRIFRFIVGSVVMPGKVIECRIVLP